MAETDRESQALKFIDGEGETIEFANWRELASFVLADASSMAWLRSAVSGMPPQVNVVVREFVNALSSASSSAEIGNSPSVAQIQTLKNAANDVLRFAPSIHGRSALQKYLIDLHDASGPKVAAYCLAMLLNANGRVKQFDVQLDNVLPAIRGGLAAEIWSRKLAMPEEAEGVLKQIKQIRQSAGELLSDTATAAEDAATSAAAAANASENSTAKVEDMSRVLENAKSWTDNKVDELLASGGARISALERTYEEKLQLSAPAYYWKSKSRSHEIAARWWAVVSIGVASGGGCALWSLIGGVMGDARVTSVPGWAQTLQIAVAALLFIWAVRTPLRLLMSNIHLSMDASERRTMVTSYLALTKRREIAEGERLALFAALFRPTGDGIIKDEAPPLPLWEMLRGGKP